MKSFIPRIKYEILSEEDILQLISTEELDDEDWLLLGKNQRLSESILSRIFETPNYKLLPYFCTQTLSEEYIDQHIDKFKNWCLNSISITQKLSEHFIEKYQDILDWEIISRHQVLSEDFIEKHSSLVDWRGISIYQNLTESFIEKHIQRMNGMFLSKYQCLSEAFIDKHWNKLNPNIYLYNYLSKNLLNKYHLFLEGDSCWLYWSLEQKIDYIIERTPFRIVFPRDSNSEPYLISFKATRKFGRSFFDPKQVYEVGKTYEIMKCDCNSDAYFSFGFSSGSLKGVLDNSPDELGEIYIVKIYLDDLGTITENMIVRSKRFTVLDSLINF